MCARGSERITAARKRHISLTADGLTCRYFVRLPIITIRTAIAAPSSANGAARRMMATAAFIDGAHRTSVSGRL